MDIINILMNDTTAQFLQENFTQKAIESLTQLSG